MTRGIFHGYTTRKSCITRTYFHIVLLIKKILHVTTVKNIKVGDHSNEAFDQYFHVVLSGSALQVYGRKLSVTIQVKTVGQKFQADAVCFTIYIRITKLTFHLTIRNMLT